MRSLDPKRREPRYFDSAISRASGAGESEETRSRLNSVERIDCSARVLVRFALAQAASAAMDRSLEWVKLAESAGTDVTAEFPVIRVALEEESMSDGTGSGGIEKQLVEDPIERLESFAKVAAAIASELRGRAAKDRAVDGE